jgi:hypothetical protein
MPTSDCYFLNRKVSSAGEGSINCREIGVGLETPVEAGVGRKVVGECRRLILRPASREAIRIVFSAHKSPESAHRAFDWW